ncbi:hypothetical protein [Butyrivibrio sp. MC2021]|uniref:hypothetical protein n=1 Tax=Butyrivibrio sp. MC2021 TaxID=1408306 RepID=UPI0012DFD1AC|nr:hypothetical protein [Butyrivibrio sp. MC2021]
MDINDYVAEEIAKYQGIAFPVKSSLIRRFFWDQTEMAEDASKYKDIRRFK